MSVCGGLKTILVGVTAAIGMYCGQAGAMQFSAIPLDDSGKVLIAAVGEIVPGDLDRLAAYVGTLPAADRIVGFALDSPGGNVVEASKIADAIRLAQATVGVMGQAKCASACFLIFAAGGRRLAETTALIGVHSASEAGAETQTSMAMTTVMAREAATLGVPPGIIGRMVSAAPGQMEWLTQRDLMSMGVLLIGPAAVPSSTANDTSLLLSRNIDRVPSRPARGSGHSVKE